MRKGWISRNWLTSKNDIKIEKRESRKIHSFFMDINQSPNNIIEASIQV